MLVDPALDALDTFADQADYALVGPRDNRVHEIRTTRFPFNTVCHLCRDFGDGRARGHDEQRRADHPRGARCAAQPGDAAPRRSGHGGPAVSGSALSTPPYTSFARIYDRVMGDAAAPIICRAFERNAERYGICFRSAADVACGTGTFLRFLAEPGKRLFGVDRSPAMLRIARARLRGLGVTLLRQEMTELRLPVPVDLVTCNFDSLNYLLRLALVRLAIEQFYSSLHYTGFLVLDMITGAGMPPVRRLVAQHIRLPDAFLSCRAALDGRRRGSVVTIRTVPLPRETAAVFLERHVQRWYPRRLICDLLRNAGFRICGTHVPLSGALAGDNDFWVQFVAQKY